MRRDGTIGPVSRGWESSEAVRPELREAWLRDGLVVLPGVVAREQVDTHVAAVAALRKSVPNGVDENGYGDRIGQLHQKLPELIDTVSSPELLDFLRWALSDEPLLFASLNFDRGTQQESHVDLIYFCTEPLYAMAGVWIALEDIHPDSGPLFYHLGSHRWFFDYPGRDDAPVSGDLLAQRANAWLSALAERVTQNGAPKKPITLRKGDAVVWHAKLAHGGMPRANPSLSRKSAVYHFIGERSRLYTFQEFFTYSRESLLTRPGLKVPVKRRGIVSYQCHDYFVTYDSGQEIVHRLK